jgi:deoxyribonuclease-4
MLLGCHLSIAGGLQNAFTQAEELGVNAMQIFSRNARSWRAKPLTNEDIINFRKAWGQSAVKYVVIHTSYLINLASPKPEVYRSSIEGLKQELERAGRLGIPHVNTHVGAHLGHGIKEGLQRVVEALDEVLKSPQASSFPEVMLLLENDAGTGTSLGARFEELAEIIDNVSHSERLGVCFDTCHGYAAGYDFTSQEGLEEMLEELECQVGLERLKLIHLNDSKHPLGSRRDRHEHIGRGKIGLHGFELLVNHPQVRDRPFILETPKAEHEGERLDSEMDRVNIRTILSLRRD